MRKLLEAEDEQATLGGWGGCAVHPLASSPLVPCQVRHCEKWDKTFSAHWGSTWCSSPGGPGNHFTEPLGPAEKGQAHTASVSGLGAGISTPALEDRQSERVILQKRQKQTRQPGESLHPFQECLRPGRHF